MPAYKDAQKGTWYAAFYYQDWKGVKKKKLKRGFPTKKEALAWERTFLLQQAADLTMTFEAFVEIYIVDKQNRLRENTWSTKEHIIRTKILPYFKEKRLCDIKPQDVIAWQNELLNYRGKNGEPYSPTYLKTLHSQFSAILNHAVRFYGLNKNAATTAGNMGSSKHQEMLFWTKEEYKKFSFEMMDKDVITTPKTKKSNRTIKMPHFLCEEMQEYLGMLYGLKKKDRIFTVTKSYLHHEMDRGAKVAGVKRIRIHDLRHSHISLLIDMGFSAVAIADRVGHESIEITYQYAHLFPSKQAEMAKRLDNLGKGDFENVSQEQR
jgi:integrase